MIFEGLPCPGEGGSERGSEGARERGSEDLYGTVRYCTGTVGTVYPVP